MANIFKIKRYTTIMDINLLYIGENLKAGTPHLGHLQVLGKSSKAVPGGVLVLGSPTSGL